MTSRPSSGGRATGRRSASPGAATARGRPGDVAETAPAAEDWRLTADAVRVDDEASLVSPSSAGCRRRTTRRGGRRARRLRPRKEYLGGGTGDDGRLVVDGEGEPAVRERHGCDEGRRPSADQSSCASITRVPEVQSVSSVSVSRTVNTPSALTYATTGRSPGLRRERRLRRRPRAGRRSCRPRPPGGSTRSGRRSASRWATAARHGRGAGQVSTGRRPSGRWRRADSGRGDGQAARRPRRLVEVAEPPFGAVRLQDPDAARCRDEHVLPRAARRVASSPPALRRRSPFRPPPDVHDHVPALRSSRGRRGLRSRPRPRRANARAASAKAWAHARRRRRASCHDRRKAPSSSGGWIASSARRAQVRSQRVLVHIELVRQLVQAPAEPSSPCRAGGRASARSRVACTRAGVEDDHGAVIRRQLAERRQHGLRVGPALRDPLWSCELQRRPPASARSASARAQSIARLTTMRWSPWSERTPPIEPVERPDRGQHGLLCDVLGRGAVVDDQVRSPVGAGPVLPEERASRSGKRPRLSPAIQARSSARNAAVARFRLERCPRERSSSDVRASDDEGS